MRITGGEFCGRALAVPRTDAIRPTQDRVRAALFNILSPVVAGSAFLDLFAGTGAVGIEALSRGALRATFVETDPRHVAALRSNLEKVGATDRGGCINILTNKRWLSKNVPGMAPNSCLIECRKWEC